MNWKWVTPCIVMCALTLAVLAWRDGAAIQGLSPRRVFQPAAQPTPWVAPAPAAPQGEAAVLAPAPAPKPEPISAMLREHPLIQQMRGLKELVVATPEQHQQLARLLANPELIDDARTVLQARHTDSLREAEEWLRLAAVDTLDACLAWKDNPARHLAVRAAVDSLVADNLGRSLPEDLRRSLAGDKIELWAMVQRWVPEEIPQLAQILNDGPHAALYRLVQVIEKETADAP